MGLESKLREFFYDTLDHYLKDSFPKKTQRFIAHFLEKTVYFFAIIGPIMTLPQVFKLFNSQEAAGFAMMTWIAYLGISTFWLFLGVFTKNRPIILANFFWVLVHVSMVIGISLYG